jgi:hypothetical protein
MGNEAMSATPENPADPADDAAGASSLGGLSGAPASAASSGSSSAAERASAGPPPPPVFAGGRPRLPSLRVTAALAAVMLVVGVAVGAAIGPAPEGSFAGIAPWLVPTLRALEAGAGQTQPAPAPAPPAQVPAITPTLSSAPALAAATPSSTPARAAAPSSPAVSSAASAPTPSAPSSPAGTSGGGKQATLPAVTSVWLIELSGASFSQALTQSASAPYLDAQLIPKGTLLSGWSAVEGSALASEVPLLTGTPPQTLETIVQPPCPEGAPSPQCAPETSGALTAADGFLQQTVPTITSLAAYRERGLIVVTFGAVGSASASGLPAGAATATLSTTPPNGVLLLSPFARAGARSTTAFNPASPRQSLEKLLHK